MEKANDLARILVATNDRSEGQLILQQLQADFADVRLSTESDHAVHDFETYRPEVIVLAFDQLAGADHYYGALQQGRAAPLPEHRTVILCNRAECATVVERCKRKDFDDYVLYWPHAYDGSRLATSVRIACREMAGMRTQRRLSPSLFGQAGHVDELDRILDVELDDTDRRAVAIRQALAAMEIEIARAVDALSERLGDTASADWIEVKDRGMLAREIDQLKARQIEAARRSGALEIETMRARVRSLKDLLEPSLAGARALVEEVRKLRPLVMIVEDDEFARELVRQTLDPVYWEAAFASDGGDAIGQLKHLRPDVILMDVRLPDTDGVSLTRRLKASPHLAAIPVIMMTADGRKETLVSSLAAGAADFVVKPFTRAVLTAKLEKFFPR